MTEVCAAALKAACLFAKKPSKAAGASALSTVCVKSEGDHWEVAATDGVCLFVVSDGWRVDDRYPAILAASEVNRFVKASDSTVSISWSGGSWDLTARGASGEERACTLEQATSSYVGYADLLPNESTGSLAAAFDAQRLEPFAKAAKLLDPKKLRGKPNSVRLTSAAGSMPPELSPIIVEFARLPEGVSVSAMLMPVRW